MELKKLTWAGILVKSQNVSILIDPLGGPIAGQELPYAAKLGEPLEPIIPLDTLKQPDAILITHVHPDHFDPKSILNAFGNEIPILAPNESSEYVKTTGFKNVYGVIPNEEYNFAHVMVHPYYSVDGYGTPQTSWIIKDDKQTLIHCGDTQWHGYWWQIERKYGPIDFACLPVNGPLLNVEALRIQSSLQACLTPEEAVEAANIMGAILVPIHYRTFNNPPYYSEAEDVEGRVLKRADELGVMVRFLQNGESLKNECNNVV